MATVEDKLKKLSEGRLNKREDPGASLATVWVEYLAEFGEGYQPPLTFKEMAQLKTFDRRCPEGESKDIMKFVLRDWTGFTYDVIRARSYGTAPDAPHIGFLLTNLKQAVDRYHESRNEVPRKQIVRPEDPKDQGPPDEPLYKKYHGPEDSKKMTLDELHSIFDDSE